ncbi:cytochrome c3 family protein [Desulforhopalus sp. IMCC35007]|uniref:cytochrome c3 family protein n=1 Tax=Desulforhopalus sp. IMCC35007 TaxID=2569543 RepID=UPI0010ADDC0A|nr:cytochrome c3 family protein [Desulforhopalus sp. IMCC35007]TKB11371.1 cytochrome C [Desulforhopalus sp. IMCC35007]
MDIKKKKKKTARLSTGLKVCLLLSLGFFFTLEACAKETADKNAISGKSAPDKVAMKAGQSCMSANCHPSMGKDKYVHGPVATGDCAFCHKQSQKDQHQFQAIKDVEALCYECHEKLEIGSFVHQPVADGECTGCHDPHQSAHQFQLKGADSDLCYECHDKAIGNSNFVHGPVAAEGCSVCHAPHSSDAPKMLMAEGNDVCYSCHSDKQEEFAAKDFIHAALEEGCVTCHSPHGSDFQFSLPGESTKGVCFTCHTEKKEEISGVTVKHGGLETDKGCMACHNPHVSSFSQQLDQAPMDLCLSCHDREYSDPDGKSVADIKTLLTKNTIHHGPIRDKDCSACHNTHGSKNFRILRGYFPQKFYASYNPDNFELCFMCHNDTLVKDPKTTTLTGFRNGDQNLHFIHVNKTPKGRTCRACHDAHATMNPKHVRNSVPFGAYQLPIGFTKTESGGGCLPGCHQEFKYDQKKMVKNR